MLSGSNPTLGHVLLIEDNEDDVLLTVRALRRQHVENPITVVATAEDALAFISRTGEHAQLPESTRIALILLDISLSGTSGLEALRAIRADPSTRLIPIIVLSGSAREDDIRDAYEAGANSYVVKPAESHLFLKLVREIATFWLGVSQPPPSD